MWPHLRVARVKHATKYNIVLMLINRACYVICLFPNLTHPSLGATPTPFFPPKENPM
jgi:hypothetical protein